MKVALQAFIPDGDPHQDGIIVAATNMIPEERGFSCAPTLASTQYPALAAATRGAALTFQVDGTMRLFAGTATALYEGANGSWTDVTRTTGGAYNLAVQDSWQFEQFGDITLAAQKQDTIQYIDDVMTDFADISGAPKAALICVVGQFVMVADTYSATYGDQGDRWWCSGYGDYSEWTPALSTQCTTGRIVDTPGSIKALKRIGDSVVAYKSNGIYVGQYVGPPLVWSWQQVDAFIGTQSPDAVVNIGGAHVFVGNDDFYMFDGASAVSIGKGVRQYFFDKLNKTYIADIRSLHDSKNSLVWWFYPTGSDNTLNRAIVYNYELNKWGVASRTIESVAQVTVDGLAYDSLGDYYATYGSLPESEYDDPIFESTGTKIAVFNSLHELTTLDGSGDTMSITTGWSGDDDRMLLVNRVRPRFIISPSSGTMQDLYSYLSGDTKTNTATITMNNGKFDVLKEARWHSYKFTFNGDTSLTGFTIGVTEGGYE